MNIPTANIQTILDDRGKPTYSFQGKRGPIILDQIRTIDKERLVKKLGVISEALPKKTLHVLQEMFA